ncbi:MAG: flavodoxin [Clostridiales bacterium]|nr:flavodoxin [Clostridiales bacterium]
MKKIVSILTAGLMIFGLTACSGNPTTVTSESTENAETKVVETETTGSEPVEETTAAGSDETYQETTAGTGKEVLVIYFSATGTTKGVAEMIADITDGDLYEIKALEEYTDEDLNWNDSNSRSTKEQDEPSARPSIGSDPISLDGYTTIYIGYPIWWGEEPRIMDTFVEGYDFTGITMIPFCTSASSGIGRSETNLEENAGIGNWLEGARFGAEVTSEELESWISGLR